MATKRRGGRPQRGGAKAPSGPRVSAPAGTYGLYTSAELLALVPESEVQECLTHGLRDLGRRFQLVNDGAAAMRRCTSKKGVVFYVVVLLDKPNRNGSADVRAGLPHEFGLKN